MGHITFTTTTFHGTSRETQVPDDTLLYDVEGKATVDPNTLDVGDELRAFAGQPGEEITDKVVS